MNDKANVATAQFKSGRFICSQAVLNAFRSDYGIDEKTAERIACGFGSGARNAELCGAVSGAVMVVGLKYGLDRKMCNEKVEEFTAAFRDKQRHIVCRELLHCDISTIDGRAVAIEQNLFQTRCAELVACAVETLSELGY